MWVCDIKYVAEHSLLHGVSLRDEERGLREARVGARVGAVVVAEEEEEEEEAADAKFKKRKFKFTNSNSERGGDLRAPTGLVEPE